MLDWKINTSFSERDYDCDCVYHGGRGEGNYSTMYGANPSETVIQLHGKSSNYYVVMGTTKKQVDNAFSTDATEKEIEMYFRSDGNDKLIAVDENLRPISEKNEFVLHRRSRLFTVEGYLTFNKDTAEFYEMNTTDNWAVAKLGAYNKAKREYAVLATEKFEGLYVKGLAYSVRHINAKGQDIDALVFRQIYKIRPGKAVD